MTSCLKRLPSWLPCHDGIDPGIKVSEKVGGAEGTKLDDDFKEMERKVDVTSRAVMEIMTKTIEYLQPNPASRAKLSMINTMSKIRGQEKGPGYPQAEALLAEAMLKFGRELGDDCNFGPALGEVGEAMRELSEVKDSLDMEVKQNFIDPLQNLHDKDLREIQHHLKKLEGRRLDFDYKKKRQGKIPDEELRQALEKFDESKEIAESSMFNLLEMDIEQVSQLSALVQAQLEYHKQAVQILQQVTVRLEERIRQASSQPRREYQPKPRMSLEFATGDSTQPNGGLSHTGTPKPGGVQMDQPCCRALYDFEPENEGELGFKEGDVITLTNQIDENCHGSPIRHPEFSLSSCTGSLRGLMCCFRCTTCRSGSCGVKGKSSCLMYKLTMEALLFPINIAEDETEANPDLVPNPISSLLHTGEVPDKRDSKNIISVFYFLLQPLKCPPDTSVNQLPVFKSGSPSLDIQRDYQAFSFKTA
ncbi:hypothetical protein STEG23_024212 [Scotinomys teguina]